MAQPVSSIIDTYCLKVAEALRTTGKMADTLLKRFIFIKNPIGIVGNQLIPISSPQIEILLVQRPYGI